MVGGGRDAGEDGVSHEVGQGVDGGGDEKAVEAAGLGSSLSSCPDGSARVGGTAGPVFSDQEGRGADWAAPRGDDESVDETRSGCPGTAAESRGS